MKFTVSKYMSNFWVFEYIDISFDIHAYFDIDTAAADI